MKVNISTDYIRKFSNNRCSLTTDYNSYSFVSDKLFDEVVETESGHMSVFIILSIIDNTVVGFIEVQELLDDSLKVVDRRGNYSNAFNTQFAKEVGLKN